MMQCDRRSAVGVLMATKLGMFEQKLSDHNHRLEWAGQRSYVEPRLDLFSGQVGKRLAAASF